MKPEIESNFIVRKGKVMVEDIAKMHFLGKNGFERLNCAQAIIMAFKNEFNLSDEYLNSFKEMGAGKAPDGYCGAFYAARTLIGLEKNNKIEDFEKYFSEHAGSLKCREIRGNRKLSCVGCVEKSSDYVKNIK